LGRKGAVECPTVARSRTKSGLVACHFTIGQSAMTAFECDGHRGSLWFAFLESDALLK
jgi:hypothetical protein